MAAMATLGMIVRMAQAGQIQLSHSGLTAGFAVEPVDMILIGLQGRD